MKPYRLGRPVIFIRYYLSPTIRLCHLSGAPDRPDGIGGLLEIACYGRFQAQRAVPSLMSNRQKRDYVKMECSFSHKDNLLRGIESTRINYWTRANGAHTRCTLIRSPKGSLYSIDVVRVQSVYCLCFNYGTELMLAHFVAVVGPGWLIS